MSMEVETNLFKKSRWGRAAFLRSKATIKKWGYRLFQKDLQNQKTEVLLRLFGCSSFASLKLLYAAGSIEDLLIARVKWVAIRADFYRKLFLRRAHSKGASACADDFSLRKIRWVRVRFHTINNSTNLNLCKFPP